MSESGSSKHEFVRRELCQLFTRAARNGMLVQNTIKAIAMIRNMLINVKLRLVFPTVVKKQFVLKIVGSMYNFFFRTTNSMLHIIFPPVTSLPLPYLHIISNTALFQKN